MLQAPQAWQCVDFLSDLHLQPAEPGTVAAWRHHLETTPADALFLLGDVFEVWVGDDAAQHPGFEQDAASVLRAAAARRPLFFMHGNRDFLVGRRWVESLGAQLLDDPTLLRFAGRSWLLSHGDALCLDDRPYQAFRRTVRSAAWQTDFLAKPLAERRALARGLRDQSEAHKRAQTVYADVDTTAARHWLAAAGSDTLIHGHTHRPAEHDLGDGLRRVVLSDWDLSASPPRAQILRLDASGLHRIEVA